MTAAETELAPVRAQSARKPDKAVERKLTVGHLLSPQRTRRHQRRLGVAIAALAIVGGTAGAATASQSALPGDSLYPMKRAVENVSATFTPSQRARGLKVLHDAGKRLREIQSLSATQSPDAGQVSSALNTFSSQAALGSDLLISDFKKNHRTDSIEQLRTFSADSVQTLAGLHSDVPDSAQGSLSDAARTLVMIDQASSAMCPSCQGGISQLPASLVAKFGPDVDGLLPDDTLNEAQALPPLTKDSQGLQLPSIDPSKLGPGSVTKTDPQKKAKGAKSPSSKASQSTGLLPSPSTSPSLPLLPSGSTTPGQDPVSTTTGTLDSTVGGLVSGLTTVIKGTTSGLLGQ
ncbi:MAG: hypothetical protein J2O46_03790 [Nocardioides sp.]|nr:hypothetical protein [Nocardioides sp.]